MDSSIRVPCTLIPIYGSNLLLPNSAIAEVLVCEEILKQENQPQWCLGQIRWDNRAIDIISFERIEVPTKQILTKRYIILIIRNPEADAAPPYFGLLATQIPQIVQANSSTLYKNLQPTNTHSCAMSYVSINGKSAIIPDIGKVAQLIQDAYIAQNTMTK